MDELRIRALTLAHGGPEGDVLVLRGEMVAEGGRPYELWPEPLRRLALTTELTDLEISVLSEIAPDLGTL
ncbi:MAG: hypothetical protein L0241_27020, partial [Planctomycetia bacterium]|nr:hypothetical protein [Planctomycetia bacterium]